MGLGLKHLYKSLNVAYFLTQNPHSNMFSLMRGTLLML